MKVINNLKVLILVTLCSLSYLSAFTQDCMPAHISFTIEKNASDIFEVYLETDEAYNAPFNLATSAQIGITFPAGFSWSGGENAFLNMQGNQGNGSWNLNSLAEEPACGQANTDYVFASLTSPANLALSVVNTPILLFTFELPGEPCIGDVALLEQTDPFVLNGGCGIITPDNQITIFGAGLCNNYLGNINNSGINCDLTVPTPVDLIEFYAYPDGKKSVLNWSTASEENNKGFEVMRSKNGVDWEVIGWVDGNGSTFEMQRYKFLDESPNNGVNYYKLKQLDFNGAFEFTDIRTVDFKSSVERASIYPNPTSGELNIELPDFEPGKVVFQVMNINKKVVFEKIYENSDALNHQINLMDLPASVYVLKVKYPKAETFIPFVLTNQK